MINSKKYIGNAAISRLLERGEVLGARSALERPEAGGSACFGATRRLAGRGQVAWCAH